jgi:hypothetical protein
MEKFLSESVSNLYRVLSWYPLLTAGVSIFFGLMWCFFGYRIFRALLVATVGLLGSVVGFSCAAVATTSGVAWIIGAMIGATFGCVVGYVFVYVSVFLLGMSFSSVVAWVFFTHVGKLAAESAFLNALVVGVAGGLLALLLMRPLLIVYTSLTGALWVVGTVVELIVAIPAFKDPTQFNVVYAQNLRPFLIRFWPIIAGCVIILFGSGVIFQFSRDSGKGGGKSEPAEAPSKPARKAKAA